MTLHEAICPTASALISHRQVKSRPQRVAEVERPRVVARCTCGAVLPDGNAGVRCACGKDWRRP